MCNSQRVLREAYFEEELQRPCGLSQVQSSAELISTKNTTSVVCDSRRIVFGDVGVGSHTSLARLSSEKRDQPRSSLRAIETASGWLLCLRVPTNTP